MWTQGCNNYSCWVAGVSQLILFQVWADFRRTCPGGIFNEDEILPFAFLTSIYLLWEKVHYDSSLAGEFINLNGLADLIWIQSFLLGTALSKMFSCVFTFVCIYSLLSWWLAKIPCKFEEKNIVYNRCSGWDIETMSPSVTVYMAASNMTAMVRCCQQHSCIGETVDTNMAGKMTLLSATWLESWHCCQQHGWKAGTVVSNRAANGTGVNNMAAKVALLSSTSLYGWHRSQQNGCKGGTIVSNTAA